MSATQDKTERGGKMKKRRKPVEEVKERPPVPIRIPPEMVDRIDAVRDPLIPREPYVRWLVEVALEQVEEEGG